MYYYLAGPMRGYPEFNHPAFARIAALLRGRGYTIANPAEKDVENGFDWTGTGGTAEELAGQDFDIDVALFADIDIIRQKTCAGVICMEGWEQSSGAKAEVAFALATGRKVYRFFEGVEGHPFDNENFLIPLTTETHARYGELHDKWQH